MKIKFKFNWGTGILLTIIIFMASMIGIIIFSMNQQVNLVSPDYYPKGVNYEEQINKSRNLAALKSKVILKKERNAIRIIFPEEFKNKKVTGNVQFYYMTDFEQDINRNIELSPDLEQIFLINGFNSGRYIVKLDWSDGTKSYYQEIDINL